ncbi:hypothetical protein N5P37_006544 [Trichoderma harzianum]|uniref:Uncharacterized protein n=1 Tax=Trichoderma harzianum CBS 226.95 TaxID=983964 RepID=A0A2T4A914_TRIHA|nr:hypothetical protein M431DRAFT_508695 [Trichoderma harzianum CBS 226.95]KAK0761591.1 hypothetical protein N5P37_006544 [Trichoderma harzianum]PKK41545.1 hypothetical protein CI102_13984 [Trichoderma harzianum]PTB53574.1 hypothetical protein M431DRAFT_508695 [Trichoderma harzianum CBS 226.95]
MALQSVQVRPHETADLNELETFIESLIGQTVPSTVSRVPVFSFKTSEENVKLIKDKFGNDVIIDAVNC